MGGGGGCGQETVIVCAHMGATYTAVCSKWLLTKTGSKDKQKIFILYFCI